MAVAGLAFLLVRLAVAAHGDITELVLAGRSFVDPALAPSGLHVFSGSGYDGQFYYRLALDPAALGLRGHGIRLDNLFRLQRIGYPVMVWLASAGRPTLVPEAMVGVNLAALSLLGVCGGVLARMGRRHALWGLLLAGYFGYLLSLGRDLTEITAAVATAAGLLALRRPRPVLAALALTAAVLTRETAMVVVGAVALADVAGRLVRHGLVGGARRCSSGTELALAAGGSAADGAEVPAPGQDRSPWSWMAWAVPAAAFVAWQVVVRLAAGRVAGAGDVAANLSVPFVAPARAVAHYVGGLPAAVSLLWSFELVVLVVLSIYATGALGRDRRLVPTHDALAWVLAVALAASLSGEVWMGAVDFRSLDFAWLLGVVVLLSSRRRLRLPAALAAAAWLVAAVHLSLFL